MGDRLLVAKCRKPGFIQQLCQQCKCVPCGCIRLIGISRRWRWTTHLPGGMPDGGPWSTVGNFLWQHDAHAPIFELTWGILGSQKLKHIQVTLLLTLPGCFTWFYGEDTKHFTILSNFICAMLHCITGQLQSNTFLVRQVKMIK